MSLHFSVVMAPKRSTSKGKVDDAAVGEVEVHRWKSSKCTDSHLLYLVGKHLLQPWSVIYWRGPKGESFPHEEGNKSVVSFLLFFGALFFPFLISSRASFTIVGFNCII